jgi:hypothetical protein
VSVGWNARTRRISSFFLVVALAVLVTRAWVYASYLLLDRTPRIAASVGGDPVRLHHYDVGALLVALSVALALSGRRPAPLLAAVGLGMVLEEWTVLVESLGVPPPTRYFSGLDLLVALAACTTVWACLYLAATRSGRPSTRPGARRR